MCIVDVAASGGVLLGSSVVCDGFQSDRPVRVQTHVHDDHMADCETSKGFQDRYMSEAVEASPDRPILVDRFLEDAIEVDVDAIADGTEIFICGVMEHIEEAGVHSGDSACSLAPHSL